MLTQYLRNVSSNILLIFQNLCSKEIHIIGPSQGILKIKDYWLVWLQKMHEITNQTT